ncbi:LysR family transcriptional regulator [Shewanella sp. 11B5]|uniref:Transcriptional regulator, LysR family n=1 Tax=Shewanella frigidimarina (strain NCIMB 400) TaxID=318167 RepID=Q086P3_SHEFN|nr:MULTISPECIES: LysR family transcriptional regulator [Shewanella]ABI70772.1 transcriptional regulator, LysR family [Shewanella frigidimarina NCIMB 400]PKI06787.1 LysR family transcriptional regulator [Shewanella sp. 11B5]
MNKFEAMRRFVHVAQTGSFTQAAAALHLPKSSISTAVESLEQLLGTRLFQRSTRRVTLTHDGAIYLAQCRQILHDIDALESQFQHENDSVRGVIKVDMPSRFANKTVLPRLSEWCERYPHVNVVISSTDYHIDPIKSGVDCLIRVGNQGNSLLIARPLTQYRIINCISPTYIQRYGTPSTLADLQHHRMIGYVPTVNHSASIDYNSAEFDYVEQGQNCQHTVPSVISVTNSDAYTSACLAGLGIAQIPQMGVTDYLNTGRLIRILHQYEAAPMPVSILYPSRSQLPKRLSLFMDWLDSIVKTAVMNQ